MRHAHKLECFSFDVACVHRPIHINRSHLLALRCTSHPASYVDWALIRARSHVRVVVVVIVASLSWPGVEGEGYSQLIGAGVQLSRDGGGIPLSRNHVVGERSAFTLTLRTCILQGSSRR